jgi:hypothetical protein
MSLRTQASAALMLIAASCVLAACQGAPRSPIPPPQGTPVAVGDWDVTTSGRVRVEGMYVGR